MAERRLHNVRRMLASIVLAFFVVFAFAQSWNIAHAVASPPNIFAYQGRLLNSSGVPVADSTASMIFRLYDASSGGTCLWSNSSATCASATAMSITLTDGLFSVALGDTGASFAAISDTVFGDNATVYLDVTVNSESMSPRRAILASPYALNSELLDGYDTTQVGATSAKIPVLDSTGNLVVTGDPQGSGVSQGSVYINPATASTAANDILLGVALEGSSRFRVDAEGDTTVAGDLGVNGGDLVTSASSMNIFTTNATTIAFASAATILDINNAAVTGVVNIGGTSQDGANTVNIATNSTSADSVNIGNSHGSTLVSVTGGGNWSISSSGTFTSNGTYTSANAVTLSSTGGDIQFDPSGASGVAYVAGGDDFAVGAGSLIAPFSVNENTNAVRIGDGANDANTPTLTFFASNALDSGTITYTDTDRFDFSGGGVTMTGNSTVPTSADATSTDVLVSSTFTGTSNDTLNTISLYGLGSFTNYSAVENATNTDHVVAGNYGGLSISGTTATLTKGFGVSGVVTNTATNASLLQPSGVVAGVGGSYIHNATATTISSAAGTYGRISSTAGTITSAIGVMGEVATTAGTITSGYGGRFTDTVAGTTRYGVYAEASGGTTNYAGFFASGRVHIDADATADTPDYATTAGDLFVSGQVELDGSFSAGDTTGTDLFLFTSGVSTTTGLQLNVNSLTSGIGFDVARSAGGSDFDGTLARLTQSNTSATSDGDVLLVTNQGAGNAVGLYIVQNTLSAHAANATGNNALVIDVNEASGSENVMIIRSDADGTPDTEFRVESDGDVFGDGASYTSGADYAEFFRSGDASLTVTRLACQDAAASESVRLCAAGERAPMGVVSSNPGFVGNNIPGASGDLRTDPNYRLIGMVGQIETSVNAGEGAIAIGDPITTSATMAGYGAKATVSSRIIGFALEPLASGQGVIRVLVQPQWYGIDVLASSGDAMNIDGDVVLSSTDTATSSATFASYGLVLRGSSWSGSAATARDMSLQTSTAGSAYRLSVVNNDGSEVAYVGESGDLAIAGRLYPSDRGTLQTSKYIYYDGSAGAGGNIMRTNAGGWGSGSYDYAEMFPSADMLAAGEVAIFADADETIRRSTGATYDNKIAGVVSTRPGFVAGENIAGHVAVALAGRVPTYVSGENGDIAIGDPLTTSTKPGYAMKATDAGPIVGYAMEAFSGATGVVTTFVRPSYYDGGPVEDAPAAENNASSVQNIATLDVSGSLNLNGGSLLSVASLVGIGRQWTLEEDGDFVTYGRIVQLVRSYAGEDVETYASASREQTISLSGTAALVDGVAVIRFEQIDPTFNDIIANTVPYRVYLTPAGMTGMLAAVDRTNEGFKIQEAGSTTGVAVDWMVVAYHKDFAPEPITPDAIAPVEPMPTSEVVDLMPDVVTEEPVENEVIEEPVVSEEATAPPVAIDEAGSEEQAEDVPPSAPEEPVITPEIVTEPTPPATEAIAETSPSEQP